MEPQLQKGDIILVRGKPKNLLSNLISKVTDSPYSHAGCYVGKDEYGIQMIIESSWGGVQLSPIDKYWGRWDAFRYHEGLNEAQASSIFTWLAFQLEKGYDYGGLLGIGMSLLRRKQINPWDNKSRYWCSELVADAYLNSNFLLDCGVDTWNVSPGDLARMKIFKKVDH